MSEWRFVQCFGDDSSVDDDLVTAVQFDSTGSYIAVGDKSGRVCVFESLPDLNGMVEYRCYTEFQSHEPEFDCLKSLEIEEKINVVEWLKRQTSALYVLATNDKTVKLWKVYERSVYAPPESFEIDDVLKLPRVEERVTTHNEKHVYANAHQYHVNSVSTSCDGEHFISADDLRINMWHVDYTSETFNVVDMKPNNLEDLSEVITSASYHPLHSHSFMYSSSRGCIQLCDLRESALFDHRGREFRPEDVGVNANFFSEITSSVSDARFTADGRYILSRDYLTMKVWDVNMERGPLCVIPIHEYLSAQLNDLYENDCIFDKFECDSSVDGQRVVSGSYSNVAVVHNLAEKSSCVIDADDRKKKKKKDTRENQAPDISKIDFQKKVIHVSWHPQMDVIAMACKNKLFLYQNMY